MLLTIVAFLFVLGIVVFVHEFGHFIVAKLNGIYVITFSFGFGPKLLRKRVGETEYAISALPFGGYVKFAGENPDEESEPEDGVPDLPEHRLYRHKHPLGKMSVVLAGPFMNALLAVLIYVLAGWFYGLYVNPATVVGAVVDGSPAAEAGFLPGDEILAVNGETFRFWDDIQRSVIFETGVPSSFLVRRGGNELALTATPVLDDSSGYWDLGLRAPLPSKVGNVKRDAPAWKAGMRAGATILAINDTTVTTYAELEEWIHPRPGVPMAFTWEQAGVVRTDTIVPAGIDAASEGEKLDVVKVGGIGIGPPYERVRLPFPDAFRHGMASVTGMLRSIVDFLVKLVTGHATVRTVGGPLRVGIMAGDMIRWGFDYLVYFIAFFSLNLAIFNMLPILPFDGGHFVIFAVEFATGRRMNQRVQNVMAQVGFVILIALIAFIFVMDIFNLFGR
ncbi:MAG: RIP metalloprotease RseP [Candidatus Krumholzibacteriota bacterium]|nr:RIP metalloprotease RseP [Candidatus Krumholzibacteriota bacterium]